MSYTGKEGCPIANFADLWAFATFSSIFNLVMSIPISFCSMTYSRLITIILFIYLTVGASFALSYTFGIIQLG